MKETFVSQSNKGQEKRQLLLNNRLFYLIQA
jgi:hypothetical protein